MKKLRKKKILLAFVALALLVSLYSNFVLVKDQERREPEYSFKEDTDPFSNVAMAIAPYRYMTTRSFEEDITLSEEFIARWDSLSELGDRLWDMTRSYSDQIHARSDQPRRYAYPENLSAYEQMYVELNKDLLEFIRDYENEYSFVSLSDADKSYLQWLFASYEQSQESGDHLIGLSNIHYNANLVQRFLFQSRFTLGLPFILCFLLLFMSIYSGEKEQGTLELLHMQPSNHRRIIFAKLSAMMLSGLFYFIILFFFMAMIALFIGLPIDGFTEVYRVFTPDQSLAMYSGGQLLLRVFFAFMLMLLFFSTLLLMISTRTGRISLTMAILFGFLGLNHVLLEVFPALRSAYHPLAQLDYLQILIGKIAYEMAGDGYYQQVVLTAEGMKASLALLIPSFIFLGLSMLPVPEHRSVSSNQRLAKSLLALEMKKIRQSQSFGYYLVGGVLLLGIFFVNPLTNDAERVEAEGLATYHIERQQELIDFFRDQTEDTGSGTKNLRKSAIGFDYRAEMKKLNAMLAKHEAFLAGDSRTYYKNAALLFEIDPITYITDGIVGGEPSNFSSDETKAILLKAAETDDPLIPTGVSGTSLQFSAREDYVSRVDREMAMRDVQPSHSAVFWPYRLLSRHHLDVLLLLAMAVIVFAGYTLDKEEGNQLEFLMTQPVSKARLHLTKLAAGMLMSSLLATALLAFAALCGLVTEGVGAYRFPIVFYAGQDFSLIPLWQYLIRILAALFFQAFFLNALMLLLSVAVRHRVQLLGATALVMGLGMAVNGLLPQGRIKTLSPFNYFKAGNLANQAVRYYNDIPQASYALGLCVLGVCGVIFTLVGIAWISRQEVKPAA